VSSNARQSAVDPHDWLNLSSLYIYTGLYASNLNVFTLESLSAISQLSYSLLFLPAHHICALCSTFIPVAVLQTDISMPRRIFRSKREALTVEWIKLKMKGFIKFMFCLLLPD
jgi:hypothetical protein